MPTTPGSIDLDILTAELEAVLPQCADKTAKDKQLLVNEAKDKARAKIAALCAERQAIRDKWADFDQANAALLMTLDSIDLVVQQFAELAATAATLADAARNKFPGDPSMLPPPYRQEKLETAINSVRVVGRIVQSGSCLAQAVRAEARTIETARKLALDPYAGLGD